MTRYCVKKVLYDGTRFHGHQTLTYSESCRLEAIGYEVKNVLECQEPPLTDDRGSYAPGKER